MSYYFFKGVSIFFTLIRWVFLINILIILVGIFSPGIQDADRFAYVRNVVSVDKQMNAAVHKFVPTEFYGRDISHLLRLVVSIILASMAGSYAYEFNYRARVLDLKKESEALKKLSVAKGEDSGKLAVLDEKLKKIETSTRSEREGLLREFVAIKKKLEGMGRNLAFLSVDVVDSTGMKASEDPIVVAHDFSEYRKFAESKLNSHGCIKSTWTPDGIMACFNTAEEAVKAAQSLINGLAEFNQSVKAMKRDFVIRCGVNAGYLLFDDSLPLEEISDKVIDVAGHMQKYAAPNAIYIAKNIVQPIQSPQHFKPAAKTVDEMDVYVWTAGKDESNQ